MKELQAKVADVFRASPHVAHVASTVGGSTGSAGALNAGRLFVELEPRTERPALQKVLADLRRDLAQVPGIAAYITPSRTSTSARALPRASISSSCRASIKT